LAAQSLLEEQGADASHVQSCSRDCLNREIFHRMLEARIKTERWRLRYSDEVSAQQAGLLDTGLAS